MMNNNQKQNQTPVKKLLYMDNRRKYLDIYARLLQQDGYQVITATTIDEAKNHLEQRYVQAAIFDIRMEDNDDDQDISGLRLAQEEIYRPLPIIALTAYPSVEYACEALGINQAGLPPAVKFLAKDENPETILKAVNQLFEDHVQLNWQLKILWRNQLSFSHVVSLIHPPDNGGLTLEETAELEGLLRQLFRHYAQITIRRVLTHQRGRVALTVFTFSTEGDQNECLLVCGQRVVIEAEEKTYQQFAPTVIGGGGTIKIDSLQTLHFAASLYSVTRNNLEETVTLTTFYHRYSIEQIQSTVHNLFETTLGTWYQRANHKYNKVTLKDYLITYFNFNSTDKLAVLQTQLSDLNQKGFSAGLPALIQPTTYLLQKLTHFEPLFDTKQYRYGTTLSNLHGDNILVDLVKNTWLIDFSYVSKGLLMRDFLSLEIAIRTTLLETLDTTERYYLEEALLNAQTLDTIFEIDTSRPEIEKAFYAITAIRQAAAKVIGPQPEPYYLGLYFYALAQIATYETTLWYTQSELMPFYQSLTCAILLYQKLTPDEGTAPPEAADGFWIDEINQELWIEQQKVMLSPQEYKFALYLYQQAGQLCERAEIAKYVFEVEPDSELHDIQNRRLVEDQINTTVSRLRKKIELDPNNHTYINVVRGRGYKLTLKQ